MEKVKIPKGDYVLHIYVEDGRAFMPEEEGGTIDPVV